MRHEEHEAIDLLVLGKKFPKVHDFMDEPCKWLGKRHRIVRHDLRAVVLMALRHQDPRAGVSALLHIGADFAPREIMKILKGAKK